MYLSIYPSKRTAIFVLLCAITLSATHAPTPCRTAASTTASRNRITQRRPGGSQNRGLGQLRTARRAGEPPFRRCWRRRWLAAQSACVPETDMASPRCFVRRRGRRILPTATGSARHNAGLLWHIWIAGRASVEFRTADAEADGASSATSASGSSAGTHASGRTRAQSTSGQHRAGQIGGCSLLLLLLLLRGQHSTAPHARTAAACSVEGG